ncbi:MAG TPA: cobalamin-binding protein [Polyangia bacterium]|nr:cobalamin-binding protein [Polyangia bacterium]
MLGARSGMRWKAVLLLAFGFYGGLGACSRGAKRSTAGPRVVHDGLGRELRLPARVERVVSLAPSSTEILYAVGAGGKIVGVDRYSNYPAVARALPQVGADMDPSLERIVALRPDVVFTATTANTQGTVENLERLGIPVYVSRVLHLEDIYGDILGLGDAVGGAEEARRLVAELRGRVATLGARYKNAAPVRTLVIIWPEPLVVAGRASHIGDLIRAAGGVNLADDSPQAFPSYSLERMLVQAPEVLIVGGHSTGGPPPLGALEQLVTVPAVQKHRVHVVDGDVVFRPGPRVVEAIDLLGRLLHPELSR